MISWVDTYKVVVTMVPLYFALGLGYASVRWWRIVAPEQCEAINRFVSCIALPLFTFQFTLHTDPFAVNYRFVAADAVSKLIVALVLVAWPKLCGGKGKYGGWSITSFSLSTLTNSLVVGVPLVGVMYGRWAEDLAVQLSVVQAIVWLTLLLFLFELRKAGCGLFSEGDDGAGGQIASIESPPPPPKDVVDGDGTFAPSNRAF